MSFSPNMVLWVGGGLGLVLLLLGLVVSLFGERSVVEERLGRYTESGGMAVSQAGNGTAAERRNPLGDFFNRLGEGTNLFESISRNLARADIKLRPAEYIAAIVGMGVVGGFAGYLLGRSFIVALAALIFGLFVPGMYVTSSEKRRLRKFDNQLGDMLNLTVNGLRAGYSTLQAMEAVSRELPSPISDEFRRVVQEMQLGIAMEEALDHLLRRISSDDLDLVITAINVQREVGGNLAEILDVISYTIRERVRIKGEISALTAQGRATAWVISLLPVVLTLLLFLVNREYIGHLIDKSAVGQPCGFIMLGVAGLMVLAGFFIVQKIVSIDI
jgi:tight adherence protein B